MQMTNSGSIILDDIYELNYFILNELEYQINPDGTLCSNNADVIQFNGLRIKASVNPNQINYPGEGEIAFDILNNVHLVRTLFGQYIQKKQEAGMEFISWMPYEYTDESEIKMSNLTVKFNNFSSITTKAFHNKCLKFLQMIFDIEEENIDLSNFDTTIEDIGKEGI